MVDTEPGPPLTVGDLAADAVATGRKRWLAAHPGPWLVELGLGETTGGFRTLEQSPTASTPTSLRLRRDARAWTVRKRTKLFPDRVLIGRAPNNDIVIPDVNVSKLHAYLTLASDACLLADAGSTNGTFVEERRIGAGATVRLAGPAVVRLGRSAVVLFVTSAGLWDLIQGGLSG